jgi:hypothetical protein
MFKLVANPLKLRCSEILVSAAVACGFAGTAAAQSVPPRFPIERSQVEAAMVKGALQVDGAEVSIGASMTSAMPNAELVIESVTLIKPHSIRLRLVCSDRSACLPFLATATYPASVDVAKFVPGRSRPAQRMAGQDHAATPAADSGKSETQRGEVAVTSAAGPVLRVGEPAMLEFDADRIHVRIEVVCLENGTTGNRIRVVTRDHKQNYVAEVVAPSLLKGELPK